MYKGIKSRPHNKEAKQEKIKDKFQILQNEEIESNGIITKQIVFKTKQYKTDTTIKWKDFEIQNLIAAGIDPKTLPTTILPANLEELEARAAAAEPILDRYEIIKQIEMEEQNNDTTTTEAQQ